MLVYPLLDSAEGKTLSLDFTLCLIAGNHLQVRIFLTCYDTIFLMALVTFQFLFYHSISLKIVWYNKNVTTEKLVKLLTAVPECQIPGICVCVRGMCMREWL